jgi:hypothetical protein
VEPHEFVKDMQRQAAEIFGPLVADDRLPEQDILAAEHRLGFRLPELLRQLYLEFGKHRQVMDGMNHLLPPHQLLIRGTYLVFCEEHQRAYFWGVHLADLMVEDPAVYQGSVDNENWYLESNHLSCFIANTMCWQAVNALPTGGQAHLAAGDLDRIASGLNRACKSADPTAEARVRGYFGPRLALCYFPRSGDVMAAAQSEARLQEFERQFNISLGRF